MAGVITVMATYIELPAILSRMKEAGYIKVKMDLSGTYNHVVLKTWGGDLKKWKELGRRRER